MQKTLCQFSNRVGQDESARSLSSDDVKVILLVPWPVIRAYLASSGAEIHYSAA
jgi:hypothetical protein